MQYEIRSTISMVKVNNGEKSRIEIKDSRKKSIHKINDELHIYK